MLVSLLRPGGVELARRWLAALQLIPPAQREAVVASVEAQIVAEFGAPVAPADDAAREMVVRYPPVQKAGYVEEVVKRYGVADPKPSSASSESAPSQRRKRSG